ncbi:hypothetical protein BV22DRAFT_1049948 [Leucogyrophana mollusca]|uniref:Uncharacterized protein n=1 Tax=Leucogyrophana mollusca TaxID=85980 RepID=A0ACB8B5F5_9AGAM|nr:hypothetical protein BV22DRAFT_1049948 [Leucogyrophana mollusca]
MLLKTAVVSLLAAAGLAAAKDVPWAATIWDGPIEDSNHKFDPHTGTVPYEGGACGGCQNFDHTVNDHFTGLYFAPLDHKMGINFYKDVGCEGGWLGWFQGYQKLTFSKSQETKLKDSSSFRVCFPKKL